MLEGVEGVVASMEFRSFQLMIFNFEFFTATDVEGMSRGG